MSRLPKDIISVLSHVAPIFSSRVWPQAQTLLLGALLAPGKRTVSAVLEVMGLGHSPSFRPIIACSIAVCGRRWRVVSVYWRC